MVVRVPKAGEKLLEIKSERPSKPFQAKHDLGGEWRRSKISRAFSLPFSRLLLSCAPILSCTVRTNSVAFVIESTNAVQNRENLSWNSGGTTFWTSETLFCLVDGSLSDERAPSGLTTCNAMYTMLIRGLHSDHRQDIPDFAFFFILSLHYDPHCTTMRFFPSASNSCVHWSTVSTVERALNLP